MKKGTANAVPFFIASQPEGLIVRKLVIYLLATIFATSNRCAAAKGVL